MIVQIRSDTDASDSITDVAVVAEKITFWSIWSYPDYPTREHPEAEIQLHLENTPRPVAAWWGSPAIARELLWELPGWVDHHLKAGAPEIDLDRQIKVLLAAGVDGWHNPTEEETKGNAPTNREE